MTVDHISDTQEHGAHPDGERVRRGQSGQQGEEEPRVEVPTTPVHEPVPRVESRPIDWVRRFDSSSVPFFTGGTGHDVEQWFRMVEARFALVGVPECERQRLAAGQLHYAAFDRWMLYQPDQESLTYDEFRGLLMREYCLPGAQTNREAAFFSRVYDPTRTITEARIRILARRLPRDVLLHASSLGDVPLTRYLEVV